MNTEEFDSIIASYDGAIRRYEDALAEVPHIQPMHRRQVRNWGEQIKIALACAVVAWDSNDRREAGKLLDGIGQLLDATLWIFSSYYLIELPPTAAIFARTTGLCNRYALSLRYGYQWQNEQGRIDALHPIAPRKYAVVEMGDA